MGFNDFCYHVHCGRRRFAKIGCAGELVFKPGKNQLFKTKMGSCLYSSRYAALNKSTRTSWRIEVA